ncbi:phage tail protein [Yersinia mollaretii]|uniref:phage tail protein n=1 Tax=Yersinia mollaretii TaxID=33060 RepID=UPI0011A5EF42|nr:phage tail protein [Yersinia mollaretii]
MTVKYFALLTNLGAAKLANAAALGTPLQITQMAVGDGGGVLPTPNPAQTQLLGEKRRAALNSLSIDEANSSQIIAEQVIPETDGGWWIREVGLFDKDGILIAIANCPDTYKPQLQEGSGRTQTVRMVLIVSSTDAITLKIDPSVVLATRKYVDDQVIVVKAYTDDLMEKHLAATDPHSRYAPKASPALTGKPTAPTAAKTDNSTQLATTAHVRQSLADYAPLASPALTGTPTTPTPAVGNNTQQVASAAFVQAAISALVASSPTTLNTLKKLADALGNDPNFAITMTDALAGKMDKDKNGGDIPDVAKFLANLGLGGIENGRLIKTSVIADTQVFHAQEKTKFIRVRQIAGGAASGAASATGASQNTITCPGGVGVYAEALFFSKFDSVLVTIGEGGQPRLGNGFNGGDTSFGNLLICSGGIGSLVGNSITPPGYSSPQGTTSAPTIDPAGVLLCSEYGQPVDPAVLIAIGVATNYHSTTRSKLGNAGMGGGGQLRASNTVQMQGIAGSKGVCIVEEYL